MQAVSVGQQGSAPVSKRTARAELRRLIHESGIVIARDRLRLLDVVGQGRHGDCRGDVLVLPSPVQ